MENFFASQKIEWLQQDSNSQWISLWMNIVECGFTLKHACDMIRTYRQNNWSRNFYSSPPPSIQNSPPGSYHQPQKQRENVHSLNQCLINNLLFHSRKGGGLCLFLCLYLFLYLYLIMLILREWNFVGIEKHLFTGGLLCSKEKMSIPIKWNIVKLSMINCKFVL